MDKTASEKRKSNRIYAVLKVSFIIQGDETRKVREGLAGNISIDGFILKGVVEPVAISTVLIVEIHSPRVLAPISVQGRVVRIEEQDKAYNLGIVFENITVNDRNLIKQWVRVQGIDKILSAAVKHSASDIHLAVGQPAIMRVHGELQNINDLILSQEEIKDLVNGMLNEIQRQQFEKELELDILYVNDFGRFRMNVYQERGQIGAALRYIPTEVKSLRDWDLPVVIGELALKPNGLILVTGVQGSGKSTTLSAMIDAINKEKKKVIVSLEEPIEYMYKMKKSIIIQREVGIDTHSFLAALKHVVRQDSNVVLIGELRDLESISFAISAAETGALVLTTLPTLDVVATVNRIMDVFPPSQQQHIRSRLAEVLRGIVSQMLVKRSDKPGRMIATEILVCASAAANIIRKGNLEDLRSIVETGSKYGMHTMSSSLQLLYENSVISRDTLESNLLAVNRKAV